MKAPNEIYLNFWVARAAVPEGQKDKDTQTSLPKLKNKQCFLYKYQIFYSDFFHF